MLSFHTEIFKYFFLYICWGEKKKDFIYRKNMYFLIKTIEIKNTVVK